MSDIADRLYPSSAPSAAPTDTQAASTASEPASEGGRTLQQIADSMFKSSAQQPDPNAGRAPSYDMRKTIAADEAQEAETAQAKADAERAKVPIEQRMWGDKSEAQQVTIPDNIRELRNDPLRRMFSAQGTFASIELQSDGVEPELMRAASAEVREMFADVGASPADAHELFTIARQIAAAPDSRADLRAEAVGAVRLQYGTDADTALADARALVARDPRVAKVLDLTGLGDHPRAVLKIIQLARSAKMRGEL